MSASFPQRVVVNIRRGATVILPGTVGASQLIDDTASRNGWDLALEHEYGGAWRPNIRAVLGKWTETGGVRSQLIHSKDVDWPGRDNRERNLVIRIDRADVPRPSAEPVTRATRVGTEAAAPRDERQGLARGATESLGQGAGRDAERGVGQSAGQGVGQSSGQSTRRWGEPAGVAPGAGQLVPALRVGTGTGTPLNYALGTPRRRPGAAADFDLDATAAGTPITGARRGTAPGTPAARNARPSTSTSGGSEAPAAGGRISTSGGGSATTSGGAPAAAPGAATPTTGRRGSATSSG
ncbi:hypothetical protein [Kitasatospora sp. MAA4]|uniref:hypothetical protein n=1 Tax=Kitasatospora sp. MAA4 TaxID=3035093 RepID=UPI00247456D6|nr:hypothetical protein [Kitasatospora sp. MAA4]